MRQKCKRQRERDVGELTDLIKNQHNYIFFSVSNFAFSSSLEYTAFVELDRGGGSGDQPNLNLYRFVKYTKKFN